MLNPVRWDIVCWKNAVFPTDVITVEEDGAPLDLTGKVLTMQVRQMEGALGSPLIDLSSATVSGDRIHVVSAPAGTFTIIIAQATLEALADAPENLPLAERKTDFAYDLLIDSEVYAYGKFTVHQGVTR